MKKLLLILFLFFGLLIDANSQPPNDDCTTAQNLGPLPVPANCPSGVGATLNIAGTTVGALEANPYIYQNGCTGAGGPNMGVPANEVWYTFVATGYQAVITVNSTFPNPNIAMYAGNCAALGGGVGGCAVGAGGTVTLTVEQMVIGTTYYVQVSGNTGQTGTFNMIIRNNKDCADCLLGSNIVVNPPPVNGMYQPGQVVNFCYTVDDYSQVNTNWIHGVQITYGAGWSGISNQVSPPAYGGGGAWDWYPSCTSTATGLVFGQGFYIDLDLDGDPGNNFGDNCDPVGTGIPCPAAATWTFCWDMTVAPGCSPGSDLSVTINTSGDGESGAWSSLGCVDDPATHTSAVGACCPPNMAAIDISCPGSSDGQATATPIGAAGPYDYTWDGPGGYVNTTTGVAGANTITNLSATGVYTVTLTDNLNCVTTATVTVNVGAGAGAAPANTGPYCEGATIDLSIGAGYTDWDWTGPGGYVQNDTQNPSIPGSTLAMGGVYTVTVTNAGGCTATGTTTVTVNPIPVPIANNGGPYCPGEQIDLTSNGGTDYDWTGPGGYVQNNTQNPSIPGATFAMSGDYTVTVTALNCSATATTTVVVNAGAPAVANNTGPYCSGATIQLSTAGGAADYDWTGPGGYVQNNTQNPIINASTTTMSGVYTVTVTYAGGCVSTGTTSVVVNQSPTALFSGNPLAGCAPLCVDFTDESLANGGVITNWNWNVESQPASNTQNVNYCFNNPGLYDATLTITAAGGCTATLTIPDYVNVSPNPVASFIYTPIEILELHPDVTFASNSVGATSWLWDFGDGSFSNVENPVHAYQDTGIFCITLLVSNNAGCTDTTVGCLYVQPEYSLYIPNTFTVNDDGLNEMWKLYGRGIKTIQVRIFDRWGEELYFFDDLAKGWPGTRQNGATCKQDVYVFRVEVTDPSNTKHVILGNVNLIR